MLINPNLLLQSQPFETPKPPTPMEAYAMQQQAQLRGLQMQGAQMDLAEKQRARDESEQFRALFRDSSIKDENELTKRIYAINPNVGMAWEKGRREAQKAKLDTLKAQTDRTSQLIATTDPNDDTSWHSAVASAFASELLTPEQAENVLVMPKEQRGAWLKQMQLGTMDAAKRFEEQRKQLAAPFEQAKTEADAAAAQAKAAQATRENAASTLIAAFNSGGAKGYADALDALPRGLASQFPAASSRKLTLDAIRKAAMSPAEQTAAEQREREIANTAANRADSQESRRVGEAARYDTAERDATTWQQNQYAELEQRIRTGIAQRMTDKDGYTTTVYRPLTAQEIDAEHTRIEAGYQALRPRYGKAAAPAQPAAAAAPASPARPAKEDPAKRTKAQQLMDAITAKQQRGQDYSKELADLKALRQGV